MRTALHRIVLGAAALLFSTTVWPAEESIDAQLTRAAALYRERLEQANAELTRTRETISREKAPMLKAMRAAEDRILAAESATNRFNIAAGQGAETRKQSQRDLDLLRRNFSYAKTLAHDGLKSLVDSGLGPAEPRASVESLQTLLQNFDQNGAAAGDAPVQAVDALLANVETALGGMVVAGRARTGEDNRLLDGHFAAVGPETFFLTTDGTVGGPVYRREGSEFPVVFPLAAWSAGDAVRTLAGQPGTIPADPTGGKAIKLETTRGSVLEHVRKGGVIAYAIVVVGFGALLLVLGKFRDLAQLRLASPETVREFLRGLTGGGGAARAGLGRLAPCTRELFGVGLEHLHRPKAVLEEHLYAVLLQQRLHYERWLPLLAVIATAAPLMGLLGTVMGMVRTFALITVFGTGNAGRLASGISEVLVATELGLMVAIPTLVVHGFLAQRIHKRLAMLERQAVEFVAAAGGVAAPVELPR